MLLSEIVAFLESPEDFEFRQNGHTLTYINEAGSISDRSRFFLAGHEFGGSYLIHVESYRGDGFESAWEAWVDSLDTIPEDEVTEAYAPDSDSDSFDDIARDELRPKFPKGPYGNDLYQGPEYDAWRARVQARAKELLAACDEPHLIEGYEYQSNATGTGIVSMGHYVNMHEADLSEIEIVRKEHTAAKP